MENIQLGSSSRAKHGGAYFSAVLDENSIRQLFWDRGNPRPATGGLALLQLQLCLQLQQNTMVTVDTDDQISLTSICQEILVNKIWSSTSTGTMVFCWSCKQSWSWSNANPPVAGLGLPRSQNSCRIEFSSRNDRKISSTVYSTTRWSQLYFIYKPVPSSSSLSVSVERGEDEGQEHNAAGHEVSSAYCQVIDISLFSQISF